MDEISELRATQAITKLSFRYVRGVDRADGDALESAFTPDAVIDYGFMKVPVAAMAGAMRRGVESPTVVSHHLIGNVEVIFRRSACHGASDV